MFQIMQPFCINNFIERTFLKFVIQRDWSRNRFDPEQIYNSVILEMVEKEKIYPFPFNYYFEIRLERSHYHSLQRWILSGFLSSWNEIRMMITECTSLMRDEELKLFVYIAIQLYSTLPQTRIDLLWSVTLQCSMIPVISEAIVTICLCQNYHA